MLKLLIISLCIFSVQSWWWPWRHQSDSHDTQFVYYNETTGVEAVITNNFMEEFTPLAFSLLKLIVTGIKLPIPDQHIGKSGLVTLSFNDVTCHELKIVKDSDAPGFYLGDGFIGLGVKLNARCRTWFKTNVPILGPGWANISLSGVYGNAHMAINYDSHTQSIIPKIDEIDLKFNKIDVRLNHSRLANFVTRSLKLAFPPIASILFKKSIRQAVNTLADSLKTFNFGRKKHYHPIFLYAPVINPQKMKLNIALAQWVNQTQSGGNDDTDNSVITWDRSERDDDTTEGTESKDQEDQANSQNDVEIDGDNSEYYDAMEDYSTVM